jgi:hypothetical protein
MYSVKLKKIKPLIVDFPIPYSCANMEPFSYCKFVFHG